MTKEHILPRFLYRQFPNQKTGYNVRADKFLTWEPQVRDVCKDCNNGPLSALDAYAQQFLLAVRSDRTYPKDADITFAYDYSLLLRWLLKVSYNSARALTETPEILRQCIEFIRDGESEHPPVAFLAVEVVRDTQVTEESRDLLPSVARSWSHIPARMFRVGPGILVDPRAREPLPEHLIRFVAINSWYFTLCIVPAGVGRRDRRRLARAYRSYHPDAVILSPEDETTSISVSARTAMDAYEFQASRVQEQWRKYASQAFPDVLSNTR